MRVWELAEELGVMSADILDLIKPHDAYVTSHLATVPRQALDAIRANPPAERWQPHQYDEWHPWNRTPASFVPRPTPLTDPATGRRRRWRLRPGPKPITFEPPYEEDARGYGNDTIAELTYEPIWTTRDITRYYGVNAATVRQWVKRGHLAPCGKQGPSHTFRRHDIAAAVNAINGRRTATGQPKDPRPGEHGGLNAAALNRLANVKPNTIVTTTEAAALLGLAPSTIRAWVRRGHLKPSRASIDPPTRGLYFRLEDIHEAARRR